MQFKFANFAESALEVALGQASAVLRIAPSDAVRFPVPTHPTHGFALVLQDGKQEPEIVYATTNPLDGSFDIERGKEDTTAKSWPAGTLVVQTITRDSIGYFTSGGNTEWMQEIQDSVDGAHAAITNEAFVRVSEDEALAVQILTLQAEVDDNSASIVTQNLAFADLNTAMASYQQTITARVDTAEASIVTLNQAVVDNNTATVTALTDLDARVGDAEAGILNEQTLRVTADEAFANDLTVIEARVGDAEAAITSETTARVDAFEAVTTAMVSLNAQYGNATAAITTESITRATEDSALAASIEALEVDFDADIGTLQAAITTEQTTRADADVALANRATTLEAHFLAGGRVTLAEAAIVTEQTTRATQDTALATSITNLTTTVTNNYNTLDAAITSEATTRSTQDTALATSITNLTTTVTNNYNTLNSAITTEQTTRASADTALATRATTLEAQNQTRNSRSLFPSVFVVSDGKFVDWGGRTGPPTRARSVTNVNFGVRTVVGVGDVAFANGVAEFCPISQVPAQSNRKFRMRARVRSSINRTDGQGNSFNVDIRGLDKDYLDGGTTSSSLVTTQTANNGTWTFFDQIFTIGAINGTTAYFRPRLRTRTGAGDDGELEVAYFEMIDVTDVENSNARITTLETVTTTPTTGLADRTTVIETAINAPTTGLSARLTTAETAITSLTANKAEVSRVTTLEALTSVRQQTGRIPDSLGSGFTASTAINSGSAPTALPGITTGSIVAVAGAALAWQQGNTANQVFGPRVALPADATKCYEVVVEYVYTALGAGAPAPRLYMYGLDESYALVDGGVFHLIAPTATVGLVQTYSRKWYASGSPFTGGTNWPAGSKWLRPVFRTMTTDGALVQIRRFEFRDITDAELQTAATARITTLETVVTTPTTGLAARTTALETTVNTPSTGLSARVTTAEGAITSLQSGKAEASTVTALTATVNGHTSTLTTHAGALSDLEGKTEAWWELIAAAGSDPAHILAKADGAGSSIAMAATAIILKNIVSGNILKVMELVSGIARFMSPVEIQVGASTLCLGPGFGTTSDLVFWFGPTMAQSAMSRANAVIWMDDNGDAYFGGSLATGVLRNSITGSDLSATAEVELGPFGTNGNPKVVSVSWSYGRDVKTDSQPTTSKTLACTVTLYRAKGSGAYAQIAQQTTSGNGNWTQMGFGEAEAPNPFGGTVGVQDWLNRYDHSLSYTFTDNDASTLDFKYKIVLSRTGSASISGGGTVLEDVFSQRYTIVSIEE